MADNYVVKETLISNLTATLAHEIVDHTQDAGEIAERVCAVMYEAIQYLADQGCESPSPALLAIELKTQAKYMIDVYREDIEWV